jgi:AraC family transcriptional regulator, transcriptional activator FtrA
MLSLPPGRSVAVLATAGTAEFELGVACEVFGTDRSDRGIPTWDFAVCLDRPGPIRSRSGFTLDSPYGLDRLAAADLVVVPCWPHLDLATAAPLTAALRAAADRGAWVLGFCSGTFALAHAGLLTGRATTHWFWADRFRALFPHVELDPDVLYVADGPVMTSAGTSAAIDLSLHVLRLVDGPEVATAVARRMVVPPHRDGGQAQYVEHPLPADDADHDLTGLLTWMTEHLHEDLTVAGLARRAHLSERTFARRFRAGTGATPHAWLTWQRVLLAQRLLETTGLDVEEVARRCGFGGAATLRHHFVARVGTSPQRYRRTFRPAA